MKRMKSFLLTLFYILNIGCGKADLSSSELEITKNMVSLSFVS